MLAKRSWESKTEQQLSSRYRTLETPHPSASAPFPPGAGLLLVPVFDFAVCKLCDRAYSEPRSLSQIGLKGIFIPQINLQREKGSLKTAKLGEIFILFLFLRFWMGEGSCFLLARTDTDCKTL